MATTSLTINKPVASLQFEVVTTGQIAILAGIDKSLSSALVGTGKFRVVVFGLNVSTFVGRFAEVVGGTVGAITAVVGSDPNAVAVDGLVVGTLTTPSGLRVTPHL